VNKISRRIWGMGKTVTEWARENGFKSAYVNAAIGGSRVKKCTGIGGQIIRALYEQGIITNEEARARGLKIQETKKEERTAA
jgi:hypothetical protein